NVSFTVANPAPVLSATLLSDDVTPVTFDFAANQDLEFSELDTGAKTVVIEFSGPAQAASDLVVNFSSFASDRADHGDDFVSDPVADEFNTLELLVAEGDTSASFTITPVDDAVWERDEVIPMRVFVPVIGALTPGTVTETSGTLDSDDVVTVSFAGSSITVREGQIASFLPAIELSGPLSEPLPLQVSVSGTATYGMDYGIRDGNGIGLGFETGAELFPVPVESTLLRIRVEVINNPEVEPEEEIIIGIDLSLSDLPDVALGDITEFVATVQDATTP
ncbi:MAG: Calx-beta domain-containing protein, partial [Myxococcota bacterium]